MKTAQTIRANQKWVKISKLASGFEFAVGHEGEVKADKRQTYPKRFVPTWKAAQELAQGMCQ